MKQNEHVWSFSTVGGVKRVNIESAGDLLNLQHLDPKLWTALSCPVDGLEIDRKTLQIIDADKDGQIRVPEVIGAVNWVTSVLKNPGDLLKQGATMPLAAINENTEEGRVLLDSARVILKNLGKADATELTVEETSDTEKIFAGAPFNGDGVITEDSVGDADLVALLNEIMVLAGSAADRGGKPGINAELLQTFFDNCEQYAAWYGRRDADAASILPLGENTEAAYQNYLAIKAKADDYFIRCRLAGFDPQSTEVLNLQVARVELITAQDLSKSLDEIAAYPLARIEAGRALPLSAGINPAWEAVTATFKELTTSPLLPGKDSITEQEWNGLATTFAAYAQWNAEKAGVLAAPLGADRVRAILAGSYREQLTALIAKDMAVEQEANNIILVDKLVRYYRDLYELLKNFVTFYDFYSPDHKAIFQAGTLYIDRRSCDLCIKVSNMARHEALASYSGMYLVYCDCTSKATNEKMTVAVALTNGDIDNLMVGRNALFYDRSGLDWDATIVKITDNPISIRQAFFTPYRKVSRFAEKQVNKVAASQDEKVSADMTKGVEAVPLKPGEAAPAAAAAEAAKKEPPKPFDVGKFVGIFAAIGLAIGAIGTTIAAVVAGFIKLAWWKMPIAVLGILLLISGPSMIIAYLKLRKRNMAPILDANGWAINANVVVNIQFGNTLTHLAELPKGAKINVNDPFTKKKKPMLPALILLLAIAAVVVYLLRKYGYVHIG